MITGEGRYRRGFAAGELAVVRRRVRLREALLAEGAEVPEGQTSVYGVLEA
jgi:hypothetical protein